MITGTGNTESWLVSFRKTILSQVIAPAYMCSGEYAIVQPNVQGKTGVDWSEAKAPFAFWIGTVSEAVYLIGTERNSDVVWGTCYVSRQWSLLATYIY